VTNVTSQTNEANVYVYVWTKENAFRMIVYVILGTFALTNCIKAMSNFNSRLPYEYYCVVNGCPVGCFSESRLSCLF